MCIHSRAPGSQKAVAFCPAGLKLYESIGQKTLKVGLLAKLMPKDFRRTAFLKDFNDRSCALFPPEAGRDLMDRVTAIFDADPEKFYHRLTN